MRAKPKREICFGEAPPSRQAPLQGPTRSILLLPVPLLWILSSSCFPGVIAALEFRSATRERGYDIYPRVCEPCVCVSESSWILAVSIPTQFLPSPQTITRRRLRSPSPLIKPQAFQSSKNRKTYTDTASLSPSLALLLTQTPSQVLHPPLPRGITNCVSWLRSSRYAAN